jgi:hypothetical protein
MLSYGHVRALRIIAEAAKEAPALTWALTGSTSFFLQGMDVQVHDIDIMTNAQDAYRLAGRLENYAVKPVSFSAAEKIKSHFGSLRIEDIDVEIMGDIQKKLPDGTWEPVFEIAPITRFVKYEDLEIPVIALEHEAKAYRILGRHERADMIGRFLLRKGGRG